MSRMTNPSYVTRIMKESEFNTKKRFGQNFLIDQNIVTRIIQAADLKEDEWVLEIGPGLGALTSQLGEKARHVLALEIDRDLVVILAQTLQSPKITIWEGDALGADWEKLLLDCGWQGEPLKLVANLPYYLTTPLIMKALEGNLSFISLVVMVQKEVAERMLATTESKDYGILSLVVQYYATGQIVLNVPRTVFIPSPGVDSAVVELVPHQSRVAAVSDISSTDLFAVIKAGFGQRRKTIRNSLKDLAKEWQLTLADLDLALSKANIKPTARAEQLSLENFSLLTKKLLGK